MRNLLILNDIHLGVERVAGTTLASQAALEAYLQTSFAAALNDHTDCDLLIAGDLFDAFVVPYLSVLGAYRSLSVWLLASGGTLWLQAGNHDIGRRDDRPSSFAFLCQILLAQFPERVKVVDRALTVRPGPHPVYLIPHCMNQDLFEAELEQAATVEAGTLVLHANCASPFAEHSDHSLNVSEEWLAKLSRRHQIVFAHEHQKRMLRYDAKPIHVLGNQWPSSIADCLSHGEAQKQGRKFLHVLRTDGTLDLAPTWQREGSFVEVDWHDLTGTTGQFIRVTGRAEAEEAAAVVNLLAAFRAEAGAFVVANAVTVAGCDATGKLTEMNLTQIKRFDVMAALLDQLTPEEAIELQTLMQED